MSTLCKVLSLLSLPLLTLSIRINIHLTESSCSDVTNRTALPHDCFSVAAWPVSDTPNSRQIIRYCLGECPSKWSDQMRENQSRLTFAQLAEQTISSRQLYLWSASIDLVERYQFYLNQQSSPMKTLMGTEFFYNCTWPRFGPLCEYSFDFDQNDTSFSSLSEFIQDFYLNHAYRPKTLTCYMHLQCNRGPSPSCLDWSEICDGRVDCLDGGEDEKHCWQLELNECEENEYRCLNGQCIPKAFHQDTQRFGDCLDGSDEVYGDTRRALRCATNEPISACEDIVCATLFQFSESFFTSSCVAERQNLLIQALLSVKPSGMLDQCWFALRCLALGYYASGLECVDYCQDGQCEVIIANLCPVGLIFIPAVPFLFGQLYFAYDKASFESSSITGEYPLKYICHNDQFCDGSSENLTCLDPKELYLDFPLSNLNRWKWSYVLPAYQRFWPCSFPKQNCPSDHFYRCRNSTKCISRHRLLDGINDCFYVDDEQLSFVRTFTSVESNKKEFFHCLTQNIYIAVHLVGNGNCDCPSDDLHICDDEYSLAKYARTHISFTVICDGFIELLPVMIDGQMFTDESDCEHWSCSNIYTRCNRFWNCPDGKDEIDCDPLPSTRCSADERFCVQLDANATRCLPVEKMNDGHIDCLGATDEVNQCRSHTDDLRRDQFYCGNSGSQSCLHSSQLCDGRDNCHNRDDERFCSNINGTLINPYPCIDSTKKSNLTEIEEFFCNRFYDEEKRWIVYFAVNDQFAETNNDSVTPIWIIHGDRKHSGRCHRGLPVKIGFDQRKSCFCPPSFYGDRCEYQNERVSLTVQFRALSDSWQTLFDFAVLLIEESDQYRIHSSEQLSYLPIRDCQMKFNLNLLYSTRPKNPSLNYSIRIDLYEKETLTHRSSWLIAVRFAFLPVQRLAVQLDIPRVNTEKDRLCSDLKCHHGRCVKSVDDRQSFCLCHSGWSGRFCQISTTCQCSADAVCLGEDVFNRSICLCPKDIFGRRCFIENNICAEKNICLNGGKCLSSDEDVLVQQSWTCICPKGFTGNRCERKQRELIVTFDEKIELLPSMLIHFIQTHRNRAHENGTTFKFIRWYGDPIRIYWSTVFDLVFLELLGKEKNYYLAVSKRSSLNPIEKKVTLSDRCLPINEIFNQTIVQLHLLRRIKFYHLPCRRPSLPLLSCFFDEVHICLCQTFGEQRLTNCVEFDHGMKRDCLGQNGCENDGQCFQDDLTCPQTSICICPVCFYGTRCQFSMNGFSLSLDAILSDHIRPNVSLRRQSSLIQITFGVTIVMVLVGWTNGILSLVTFKTKKVREVGCGYYLLGSSLSTLMTMTMFIVKFVLLLFIQLGSVTNRTLLSVQCSSLDFLLRIGLNMDQWLNACVAVERATMLVEGTRFNKSKSRQRAKYIIPTLLVIIMASTVYDPIYRRLLDDQSFDEEKRVWCIVSYPPWLKAFDSTINMIHFLVPFGANLISAVIIIWKSARQKTNIRRNFDFKQLLAKQFRRHKHLLITPFLIVTLGLPRIIISVASGCMKSNRNPWLYLLGYLISFICPMLTFVLFVVPSKLYTTEFNESIRQYRRNFPIRIISFRHIWSV